MRTQIVPEGWTAEFRRWEHRRGSTLYLVYNTANSDQSRPGEFSPFRDLRTGFGAPGTQVLMVKLNYWLGL